MHRNLLAVVALLILAAAGTVYWILGGGGAGPAPGGPAAAPAAPPSAPATLPAGGDRARGEAPPAPPETTARVEAAAGPGAGGPFLVGQVVDEEGAAIAGARVLCVAGGTFVPGLDDIDQDDLEGGFDLAAMTERELVRLRDAESATTDADGRFRLGASFDARTVGLRVQARGYVVLDRTAARPQGHDDDLGRLVLQRGAVVEGRVVDALGNGVAGARVARLQAVEERMLQGMDLEVPEAASVADLQASDLAVTDAAGRFALEHVEPGEFALRARHPDHPSARSAQLAAKAGQTLGNVLITVEPGAAIAGRIVGVPQGVQGLRVLALGRPPANAEAPPFLQALSGDLLGEIGLPFGERSAEVGQDHEFTLRGLHADRTYRICAVQSGRGFTGSAPCSARVEVPAGRVGVELQYETGITVTFRVVDARSGAPIENLWVDAELRGGNGFADMMALAHGPAHGRHYQDGRVTVAGLRPKKDQTLRLGIAALGHAELLRESIALPAEGPLDLGTLRLEPGPVVHATVRAADSGRPVAGARVSLRRAAEREDTLARGVAAARAASTDAEGRCVLNSDLGAAVVIAVASKAFAPYASETITLPGAGDYQFEARLLRGGAVDVTVADAGAAPVRDARVEHEAPDGAHDAQKTDGQGTCRFERLAPGQHRFRLATDPATLVAIVAAASGRAAQPEAGWREVAVADGARAALLLRKDPTASLRGVVRENGLVLAGARVAFLAGPGGNAAEEPAQEMIMDLVGQAGGGRDRTARTGEDGAYRLRELPPGEHRLRVTHKDRAMPAVFAVTLREGDNVFDVALDAAVVRGIVRDPDGRPVAGARVRVRAAPAAGAATDQAARLVQEMLPGMVPGGAVKTGDDGSYELRGVQTGVALAVHATAKGFAPASSAPIEVERGGTKDGVDLTLGAAGRIEITVAEPGPMTAATATFGDEKAGVDPVMRILRQGKGVLDGLRPGTWKVEIQGADGKEREPRVVEVKAGETAAVAF